MRDLLFRSLKDIRRIAPRSLIMQVICMMLQSVLVAVNTWLVSVFLNHVYMKDLKIKYDIFRCHMGRICCVRGVK